MKSIDDDEMLKEEERKEDNDQVLITPFQLFPWLVCASRLSDEHLSRSLFFIHSFILFFYFSFFPA